MSTLSDVAELFWSGFEILAPFLGVTLAGAGVALVNELKRKGYQATYLEALVRATGAGVAAAHAQKLDPFTGEGKRLVLAVGSEYLADTVGDAANAFGLGSDTPLAGLGKTVDGLGRLGWGWGARRRLRLCSIFSGGLDVAIDLGLHVSRELVGKAVQQIEQLGLPGVVRVPAGQIVLDH
jgi:hypothetical protein